MSTIAPADVATSRTPRAGLLDHLRQWLQQLFGGAARAAHPEVCRDTAPAIDEEDEGPFVIAPGGYRIRVPQANQLNSCVGDMLPAVREGLALLPPLPVVVIDLLREIQDPKSTASSVAQIASSDPALAASLIRTVNAAAMGLSRKISCASEAVSYLGFGAVKSIVVRLRLEQVLQSKTPEAAIEAEDLWVHSLAVSYAAECLAHRVSGVDAGYCATLGLLHDIGRLAINAQLPEQAAKLREPSSEHTLDRELEMFGVDHAGLGADLAAKWKLPADLVQSIRYHHRPSEAFHSTDPLALRQAVHIVHIADQLAKYCYPHADHIDIDATSDAAFALLRLPPSLPALLDDKMRAAIARAVLFAEANTRRPAAAPRRFLRLLSGATADSAVANSTGACRVCIDGDAIDGLCTGDVTTVKIVNTPIDALRSIETGLKRIRFTTAATGAGIEKCVNAISKYQESMDLAAQQRATALLIARSLLPNLLVVSESQEEIAVLLAVIDGTLNLVARAPGMGTARRLSDHAAPEAAIRLAEAEMAHLLNLGLVTRVAISADGASILFQM